MSKRIKLVKDIPIEAKHGCIKGREFNVLENPKDEDGYVDRKVWIISDAKERVLLKSREYEILDMEE